MAADNRPQLRRGFLKAVGASSVGITLAGCTDDDSGEQDIDTDDGADDGSTDDGSWPPPRNLVEFITPTNPGSTRDLVGRYWADFMQEHYPDGVSTSVSATPGAQGILAANAGANADPDGGTVLCLDFVPMLMNEIQREEADYTTTDFANWAIVRQVTRGVQVNHRTTDVEDHWEMTYDELIDAVIEDEWVGGSATGTQYLFYEVLERVEPRLEEGDLNIVTFDGGGELRAAVERGDIDWYCGGFTSNYNREQFYKTQFAVSDDRYPEMNEKIYGNDENAVLLGELGMDEEGAETLIDMMVDAIGLHLPPGTPDNIVETHIETFDTTAEEEPELEETINNALGPGEFVAISGEEVEEQVAAKAQVMYDNQDLLPTEF